MIIRASQTTMPTFELCCCNGTKGGRHGYHLSTELGGPLSTVGVGIHAADGGHVSSPLVLGWQSAINRTEADRIPENE
jgi:hypothetical protein